MWRIQEIESLESEWELDLQQPVSAYNEWGFVLRLLGKYKDEQKMLL